ncbi:bifunctional folylpolyglutamate synthase/dihydrofolate synthase [Bacillaceae bacterium Marseille-Q3522]|nr:bifunctional folylpolyglutamate synthase/dihydrofolate synthase [Bacillaceae bacterium Marseille-Q3522]
MFRSYEEALAWIHSRLRLGMKPGLKRMTWMMEKMDHPERKITTLHVGGTNGKGSTVTYLRSILEKGGYKTGTFTSPYLEQFNERISVNGKPISDEAIVKLANVTYPLTVELEKTELGGPTEFEIITAMAFYYFAYMEKIDVAVFEVGLGGRLDSTNIICPLLAIITNIGLDHTQILGETHREIAFEKAGIIKKEVPIFTAVKQQEALDVIKKKAAAEKAPLFVLGKDFSILEHTTLENGEQFTMMTMEQEQKSYQLQMIGAYQAENAALAAAAAKYLRKNDLFPLREVDIASGLSAAFWPGRFEIISHDPSIILDGAHNDEGVTALAEELENRYHSFTIRIIFAALKDKKLDKMIARLDKIAASITFTTFDYPRASSAEHLYGLSSSPGKHLSNDWENTVKEAVSSVSCGEILVITGSLYFISEVRAFLRKTQFIAD